MFFLKWETQNTISNWRNGFKIVFHFKKWNFLKLPSALIIKIGDSLDYCGEFIWNGIRGHIPTRLALLVWSNSRGLPPTFQEEIYRLEKGIESDQKLKHMAELQISVVADPASKHQIQVGEGSSRTITVKLNTRARPHLHNFMPTSFSQM